MRKRWAFGLAIVALVAAQPALAGDIDEGLKPIMTVTPAGGIISTLVFLNDQVDIDLLNAQLDLEHAKLQRRHEVVVRALQQVAADTQGAFLNNMRALETAGRIERLHAYWISNVFRGMSVHSPRRGGWRRFFGRSAPRGGGSSRAWPTRPPPSKSRPHGPTSSTDPTP